MGKERSPGARGVSPSDSGVSTGSGGNAAGAGTGSATEYFANTNILTCRLKWGDPDTFITDPKKSQLMGRLNQLVHLNKGLLVNPKEMENYQYFSDRERLQHLEQNLDCYLFERGNVEVDKWYRDCVFESSKTSWFYDVVLQAQFKGYKDLQATKEGFLAELNSAVSTVQKAELSPDSADEGAAGAGTAGVTVNLLDCWSISENPHALNHPGNLYVRGIPKNLTREDLMPIFAKFGPVLMLKIICDPNTNKSLGFGFVSYPLGSQASNCIKELNGNLMNKSLLFVNYHVERKERERIHFDQWKQNEQEESTKFRGVFVGNLPILTDDNKLLTPGIVLEKFKKELSDCEIVSYYFPKSNSQTNLEYSETNGDSHSDSQSVSPLDSKSPIDEILNKAEEEAAAEEAEEEAEETEESHIDDLVEGDETASESKIDTQKQASTEPGSTQSVATNEETCESQDEDCPLKGYGFIRFSTHEMALKCIEKFHDTQWYGHQIVVNKANQKFHQHQYSFNNGNGSSSSSISSIGSSHLSHQNSNVSFHGQTSPHHGYYQQPPYFPPMYSFRISRRHSERPVSSRQSSMMGYSPPPMGFIPINEGTHSRKNSSHSRSISRQNSAHSIQSYNGDQLVDPHSPHSASQNSLPPPPLSQELYHLQLQGGPNPIPSALGQPSLIPQPGLVLTNSSTNSTGSPRNNSVYGPPNIPLSYSTANPFNIPLPIPRSDEQESNLYVKHIPLEWKDEDLYEFFEKFGEIISAKIITVGGSIKQQGDQDIKKDELFGKSKGYGFVCFQNPLDASKAMYHTDGLKLTPDNTLFVSFAQRRSKSIDSIRTPTTSNNVNYNKKFMNAMYQQQKHNNMPWMVPVPVYYPPPSSS